MFSNNRMAEDFTRIYLHFGNYKQPPRWPNPGLTRFQSPLILWHPIWRTTCAWQIFEKFKSSTYKWLHWKDFFGKLVFYVSNESILYIFILNASIVFQAIEQTNLDLEVQRKILHMVSRSLLILYLYFVSSFYDQHVISPQIINTKSCM